MDTDHTHRCPPEEMKRNSVMEGKRTGLLVLPTDRYFPV